MDVVGLCVGVLLLDGIERSTVKQVLDVARTTRFTLCGNTDLVSLCVRTEDPRRIWHMRFWPIPWGSSQMNMPTGGYT